MNIKKVEEKLKIEDFSNINKIENFKNFIQTEILDTVLFAIIGEANDIRIDRRYDFVFEQSTIDICSPFLINEERFFNKETEKYLSENKIENVCILVDEDYDVSEYTNQKIEKTEIKNLKIVPTYITFDEIYFKIDNVFSGYDKHELFEIKSSISKVIEDFYNREDIVPDFQIGGNIIHCIQGTYKNLISYYYGDYGDCGAVYTYLDKTYINSTVDMH